MGKTLEAMNGLTIVFRFITPAFLGLLIWMVQDMQQDLKTLRNDYYHQLISINERIGKLEARNTVMNGLSRQP